MKATKLEKKHPIGRRYRVVNNVLSSKRISSMPRTNKPISASKMPILVYFESLLRVNIPLMSCMLNPKMFFGQVSLATKKVVFTSPS